MQEKIIEEEDDVIDRDMCFYPQKWVCDSNKKIMWDTVRTICDQCNAILNMTQLPCASVQHLFIFLKRYTSLPENRMGCNPNNICNTEKSLIFFSYETKSYYSIAIPDLSTWESKLTTDGTSGLKLEFLSPATMLLSRKILIILNYDVKLSKSLTLLRSDITVHMIF